MFTFYKLEETLTSPRKVSSCASKIYLGTSKASGGEEGTSRKSFFFYVYGGIYIRKE